MSMPLPSPRLLPLLASLAATAAVASVPTGRHFGPWHVVSIASASGASRDDAFAMMVQERRGSGLKAEWEQNGPIIVSIDIDRCGRGRADFERSDLVEQEAWLAMADGGAARLRTHFAAWLAEARRHCPGRAAAFRLDSLAQAARDLTARIRALGAR